MQIGISINSLFTLTRNSKNIDGIGAYTHELCQSLKKQNVQIAEIYFKKLGETFQKSTIKQEDWIVYPHRLLSLLPGPLRFKKNMDILHITDYYVPKIKNTPIISTLHDAIMMKHKEWLNSPRYLLELKNQLLIRMCQNVDKVITISHAVVDDIIHYFKIPEHKISVIYHGISARWFQRQEAWQKDRVLKQYQIEKPFFLSVGTVQPRKNLERVIHAFQALPDFIKQHFHLIIVGKDYPRLTSPHLKTQLQSLSEKRQVIWLQYLSDSDLQCLYQQAHALLYPSLAEGFGFPILEGFASGTPVITSNFGSMAEIGADAAYQVEAYSEESIRNAMIDIVEQPTLREQLVQKGLERSRLFTWEKCAAETLALYKTLL